MNDMKKNTELFVNILGMARTSHVKEWDREALKRAFKWAHYFEQVHKKTKANRSAIEKVNEHLQTAVSEHNKLGLSTLVYNDLKSSTSILRKYLLENPDLDRELYMELAEQAKTDEIEEMKRQLGSLSKLKAALQILQLMIQKRFENLGDEKTEGASAAAKSDVAKEVKCQLTANAQLLKKYMKNILDDGQHKGSHLYKELFNMVHKQHGVDVLITTILLPDKDEHVSKYILEFIHDVMVPTWKKEWRDFVQIPSLNLFSECAKLHYEFMVDYLGVLKHTIENIQRDMDEKHFTLDMERKDCEASEQMSKYYYYLVQSSLQKLINKCLENEINVDHFVKKNCESLPQGATLENNVWKRLSAELLISS